MIFGVRRRLPPGGARVRNSEIMDRRPAATGAGGPERWAGVEGRSGGPAVVVSAACDRDDGPGRAGVAAAAATTIMRVMICRARRRRANKSLRLNCRPGCTYLQL